MLALERHVRVPFETQAGDRDFDAFDRAGALVRELAETSNAHIDRLDRCLENLGGHEASPVKSAVAQVEGAVAGAIDKMRKTKVSKALRDDYTALALCCAGYSALLATANAFDDATVASAAEELLEDYARLVMRIGETLPAVVVEELRALGLRVDATSAHESRRLVSGAWRGSAREVRQDAGTGSRGTIGAPGTTAETESQTR